MFPSSEDLFLVGFLVFLEGILSIDNALVLALMAKHLPQDQQKRALTYGLGGAIVFRLASLGLVTQLMRWNWIKFVGGGYLIFTAARQLFTTHKEIEKDAKGMGFWKTVLMIELMDIAFAVDSILAAVALTKKFWIVFTGGFLGVILMRFAASLFLKLLRQFPGLENTAYLLIFVVGTKLVLEGFHVPQLAFETPGSPAFLIFWILMLACILFGLLVKKDPPNTPKAPTL